MSTRSITPDEWLEHLLNFDGILEFVKNGGSLIRFATVGDDETHESLAKCINVIREENKLWLFTARDADCRIYAPDEVVALLATDLPLDIGDILEALIRKIWLSLGVTNQEIVLTIEAAGFLECDSDFLRRQFNVKIRELMGRSFNLNVAEPKTEQIWSFTRDFSNAVINVCLDIIDEQFAPSLATFKNWLENDLSNASDRRKIGIMSPLKRDNATGILRSLIALCVMSDSTPCILHLDIRGVTDASLFADCDQTLNVTKMNRINTYQWIRELIDQTAMFKNTFIIIETGPLFSDISPNGKGVGMYDALKNRIIDDVSVNGASNASAVLVPLSV